MPDRLPLRPRDFWVAALIGGGLLLFGLNLGAYFLADDFVLLAWTPVHSLGDLAGFFDPQTTWFYRPLVKVVYGLGQGFWGLHAVQLHGVSLLLHGLNAWLLYRLLAEQRVLSWGAALAASLLFLLNPHHAEPVSWIAAVGDLIAAACILGALLAFRRFCAEPTPQRNPQPLGRKKEINKKLFHNFLFIFLFIIGLLARETAILLPLLLLLDAIIFRRTIAWNWVRRVVVAAEVGAVLAAYGLLQAARPPAAGSPLARGGLQFHALNFDSILLGVMDYVHGLLPGGSRIAQLPLDTLRWVVAGEALALAVIAVLLWRTGARTLLWGLAWLVTTPLLFVFFSGPTDRYFYLPAIGYAITLAALADGLIRAITRVRPAAATNARRLVAVALAALLIGQSTDLLAGVQRWATAGRISGGIAHDLRQIAPTLDDDTTVYFVDVPPVRDGVPLLQNGAQELVQLTHANNPTLAGAVLACADLQQAPLPSRVLLLAYTGDGLRPLARPQDCR